MAINLITSPHGRELPGTFYLIAYDFGGGTVDTSVLEVHLPEDTTALRTKYIGIGGRSDFGGDDVTRAVMMVLHQRLTSALQGWNSRPDGPDTAELAGFNLIDGKTDRPASLQEIPLVADGEPLRDGKEDTAHWHLLGRQNWDAFWRFAESIKFDLCSEPPTDPASGAESRPNYVEELLKVRLQNIKCRLLLYNPEGDPGKVARNLDQVLDPLNAEQKKAFFQQLRFDLNEVYDHPLDDTDMVNNGQRFKVRERVDETVRELRAQCSAKGVEPNIIVLAGGGCRLPLIAERMGHYFPSTSLKKLLYYEKEFAKRRVAYGMASYLALRQIMDLDHRLARSVDVLHRPLGLSRVRLSEGMIKPVFELIAPVGTSINAPGTWHSFRFRGGQVREEQGRRRLPLFVLDRQGKPLLLGQFELPAPSEDAAGLPALKSDGDYAGELRLCGVRHLEMCVVLTNGRRGPYPFKPAVNDPETLLQG